MQNMDQFNLLISQASNAIMCDSNCQKTKEAEKLKQTFLNAQTNLHSAPAQVQVAEKNYVTFAEGDVAYNELIDSQLQEKAQTIADNFMETYNQEVLKIRTQIETYGGLLLNVTNVFDLFRKYKQENIALFKELKTESGDVLTNERKTYYADQQIDGLKYYYYYFLAIIYIICIICFIVFSLFYNSSTTIKSRLIIFVMLIALPFASSWILGSLIYLLYEMYYLLPKNVYK